jgi:SAM-dependent methyltransferase
MCESERRQEEWEARYQLGLTGWDRGAVSPALEHWLAVGYLEPCHILVPGCGHGYEVLALARRTFSVTAVDISPMALTALDGMLDQAGVSAEVVHADLLEWMPGQPFDAVYEQTALCALLPDTWAEYARRLRAWLKPGGRLFALFMQSGRPGGPPFHCDLNDMRRLFSDADWLWPNAPPLDVPHPTGLRELGFALTSRS